MIENLDPIKYPTLSKYPTETIEVALGKLKEKYPTMNDEECLRNLEADMYQQEEQS